MSEQEGAVGRAWDRNADAWTRQVRAGGDLLRERMNRPMFMAFLPDLEGRNVIDLGCGEGSSARMLAEVGARVTGIDLSEDSLQRLPPRRRRAHAASHTGAIPSPASRPATTRASMPRSRSWP